MVSWVGSKIKKSSSCFIINLRSRQTFASHVSRNVGTSTSSFAAVLRKARRGSLAIVKTPVNTKLQSDVAKNRMRFTITVSFVRVLPTCVSTKMSDHWPYAESLVPPGSTIFRPYFHI